MHNPNLSPHQSNSSLDSETITWRRPNQMMNKRPLTVEPNAPGHTV